MNCASHLTEVAVATCQGCGKGLCSTCANQFRVPLCVPCAVAENRKALAHNKELIMEELRPLMWSGVPFILIFGLAVTNSGANGIVPGAIFGFLVAMLPAGWRFLSRFFNNGSGYAYMHMRYLALATHLLGSMFLGVIVGPFQIWKAISRIRKLQALNAAILQSGYVDADAAQSQNKQSAEV